MQKPSPMPPDPRLFTMPTYDYACENCGHEFELFQQMTAPVKRKCPECGANKLKRLIGTGAGVIFKGGGFYETDYRSGSYKKAADADKKSAEDKPEKSDKKDAKAKIDAKTEKNSDIAGASSSGATEKKPKATDS